MFNFSMNVNDGHLLFCNNTYGDKVRYFVLVSVWESKQWRFSIELSGLVGLDKIYGQS